MSAPGPDSTYASWRENVERELGGADAFERRLVRRTADGLRLEPLYAPGGPGAEGDGLVAAWLALGSEARPSRGWIIRQRLDPARSDAVALAAADVANDVGSLEVAGDARSAELAASLPADAVEIAFDGGDPFAALEGAARAWERLGVPLSRRRLALGADPVDAAADGGWPRARLDAALGALPALWRSARRLAPAAFPVRISADRWQEAGIAPARALGIGLATGAACLRALEAGGMPPEEAAGGIELRLAVGVEFFQGIALLRAARLAWARLLEACDVARPLRLVAAAERRRLTTLDPWTNLLRGSVAAFAGAVGGADVVTLPPHDLLAGPGELGHRLARNVQHVLREEGHLHRVLDPAAGSWFLEAHTEELAQVAWEEFTGIEAAGGVAPLLAGGTLATWAAEGRAARAEAVRTREVTVVGVNEFGAPDAGAAPPFPSGPATPLGRMRDAEPFERLQAAAARWAARTGGRPRVFLARVGSATDAAPRVGFARGVVEAGGVAAVEGPDADGDAALARAFRAAGTAAVIICGSDAAYAERALDAARALWAAGAGFVALAGRPGDRADELRAAGVDAFVHRGSDLVSFLERLHARLGVGR